MKGTIMNIKLRLKNKTTLITLLLALVTCVYSVLAVLGITPSITQDQANNVIVTIVTLLVALGIVVDPTTSGVNDSAQALAYDAPAASITTQPVSVTTVSSTPDGVKALTVDDAKALMMAAKSKDAA